jgi:hypothetical protein
MVTFFERPLGQRSYCMAGQVWLPSQTRRWTQSGGHNQEPQTDDFHSFPSEVHTILQIVCKIAEKTNANHHDWQTNWESSDGGHNQEHVNLTCPHHFPYTGEFDLRLLPSIHLNVGKPVGNPPSPRARQSASQHAGKSASHVYIYIHTVSSHC